MSRYLFNSAAVSLVLLVGCGGEAGPAAAAAKADDELLFFFVMHVEPAAPAESERDPLPRQAYDAIRSTVLAAADVLEEHGARGNFQIVYRVATDAATYEGDANFVRQLLERGHAIAVHSHHWMFMQDAAECAELCGLRCASGPGTDPGACFVNPGGVGDTFAALGALGVADLHTLAYRSYTIADLEGDDGFSRAERLGVRIINDNESPGDAFQTRFRDCAAVGIGDNDSYSATGNYLHPWRPDYRAGNSCAHDPDGPILYVDQVTGDWLRTTQPEHHSFTDADFDVLRDYFAGALAERSSTQLNVWGFPQHPTEYRTDLVGSADATALGALDRFLGEVDSHVAAGTVRYATLDDIEAAFIERRQ